MCNSCINKYRHYNINKCHHGHQYNKYNDYNRHHNNNYNYGHHNGYHNCECYCRHSDWKLYYCKKCQKYKIYH